MEKNENITFYDLTPTDNIELDIYEKAINFSLENNKIFLPIVIIPFYIFSFFL